MPNHDTIIRKLMAEAQAEMDYCAKKIAELEAKRVEAEAKLDALEAALPEDGNGGE